MDASKRYQRAVFQFLTVENVSACEIYRQMQNMYSMECMGLKLVFSEGEGIFAVEETVLTTSSYSPDVSPCQYRIFCPLKRALKGRQFANVNEIHAAVENCIYYHPQSFFTHDFQLPVDRRDTCFNLQGYFVQTICYTCINYFSFVY
ncbi:hypothetical protein TNCV_3432221 [Trichonephila clavipes]|nr:hypothetical protein TNCV_3432221 [Trichonephila clavipes]